MSERIRWIDCEGFTILSIDYSDLPEDEYLNTMDEVIQFLYALQGASSDSPMLILANVTNTNSTNRIVDKLREVSTVAGGFPRHAHAVVGGKGPIGLLARVSRSNMYFTHTEPDARNWLVKQAKRLQST
jgi:hypothetical protein